jgi:RNA polymerase sigma-70 factor (ECF subfamily)
MDSSQKNFSQIYQEYERPMFNYILRMVQDHETAEDLTQEVFVRVYQHRSTFRGESSFSTWIYRLATNLCRDHFRKKSSRQERRTDVLGIGPSAENLNIERSQSYDRTSPISADEMVIKSEMNVCIRNYIDRLPEDYRAVIILSELHDLKNQEIAEIVECSLEIVKIRLHRARKRLKETLGANCTFYYDGENNLCCDKKQGEEVSHEMSRI